MNDDPRREYIRKHNVQICRDCVNWCGPAWRYKPLCNAGEPWKMRMMWGQCEKLKRFDERPPERVRERTLDLFNAYGSPGETVRVDTTLSMFDERGGIGETVRTGGGR